jgi:hypothetical protein
LIQGVKKTLPCALGAGIIPHALGCDGTEAKKVLGNPQSRGIPTWFIIPAGDYANAIIESLPPEKKKMARNFLPLNPK